MGEPVNHKSIFFGLVLYFPTEIYAESKAKWYFCNHFIILQIWDHPQQTKEETQTLQAQMLAWRKINLCVTVVGKDMY